jgi:hypothetical protein|tara:strand:- start:869 stop:1402 length:534 start_codon:yes stop_codon:yes gene_type:complete
MKSINPSTWNEAVGVVAQHVDFRRTSLVHPDHEDEAKSLRMLRDEVEFICAKAYGAVLEFPNQNLFDWFTSYTILALNVGSHSKLFGYESAEDVAQSIQNDYVITGGAHLSQMGVDAVLVHLHSLATEVTGWHFWWDTELAEEACMRALEEMAEWSLRGMLLSWNLWDLPPAVQECI